MDVADLISSFETQTSYKAVRRAKAAFVAGRAVPQDVTTLQIVASVQPITGRDLMRVPEDRRSQESRVLYTTTQLYTGAQGAAFEADLVLIDGQQWEVSHAERWWQWLGEATHWRVIVTARVGQPFQVPV